jgi:8-oxo-dGTP pyrophosphatase MutT (NUDIX family)
MRGRTKLETVERAVTSREPLIVRLEGSLARAAVAVIHDPRDDDVHLCFIHRAVDARDPWSGHMGFPGGFMEPHDPDLASTVAREVAEEIGLDLRRSARLVGRLDEIQGVARGRQLPLVISPFLFELRERVELRPNEEVQSVLWVPLGFLEDERNESTIEHRIDDTVMRLPAYVYGGRTIWGLTFRMVKNLLDVLRASPPSERAGVGK